MRKYIAFVLALVCVLGLVGCNQKVELQQGDNNMQYFFTAKVIEVDEEYLLLEVFDIGNTNLSEGVTVEVSTDVVAAKGCPEFVVDECARVLLARNTEDKPAERLNALSIYKTDETGTVNQDIPEPMAYAFEAQYIRTNGYSEERSYPYHVVINSKEELDAYYKANKELFDLERKEKVYSDTTIGFLDACDKYDDSYFERQNLVLIVLEEGSGSIRHEITDVRPHSNENGGLIGWDIIINRIVPEVGTDDMAQWHLLLEVQMGDVIKSDDDVWINGKLSGTTTDK